MVKLGFGLQISTRIRILFLILPSLLIAKSHPSSQEIRVLVAERRIDSTSSIIKVYLNLKVENVGSSDASEIILAFPPTEAEHIAILKASATEGKHKRKTYIPLEVNPTELPDTPNGAELYSIALFKPLKSGEKARLEVHYVVTHSLEPFPIEIGICFFFVSTSFRRVLLQRLEYQARPSMHGAASFKHLLARLPPRVHSVYYRDEIGNVSTSHLWSDSLKSELEIEPRYPLFGGWKATFIIGYGLPLHDFLFESPNGQRYLNFSFGCPLLDTIVDDLTIKVVLPEGSKNLSVAVPFPIDQETEVYYDFSPMLMLAEPVTLVSAFFLFFVACIAYLHVDLSIGKSSSEAR